jgi:nicotinate-nucleotide pyrophosphorylase (carboxylating)
MSANESFEHLSAVQLAEWALREDRASLDKTTEQLDLFLKLKNQKNEFNQSFIVSAKAEGVFSGIEWISAISKVSGLDMSTRWREGEIFTPGSVIVNGRGPWQKILQVERSLINLLQALCGTASVTSLFVKKVKKRWKDELGFSEEKMPKIYHTRKTLPLLRDLQVKAVLAGGGFEHRKNLEERVLFKENHKFILLGQNQKFSDLVKFVVSYHPEAQFEVENIEEARMASEAGARHLLLDNFTPEKVELAGRELNPTGVFLEVSGSLNLENISQFVCPGISRLSVGALTHSVRAIDMSLDWI